MRSSSVQACMRSEERLIQLACYASTVVEKIIISFVRRSSVRQSRAGILLRRRKLGFSRLRDKAHQAIVHHAKALNDRESRKVAIFGN